MPADLPMPLSRRQFGRLLAGGAGAAALGALGRTALRAAPVAGYKAMVGIFLFGGNDGWNMVVPNDARYAGYASLRGDIAVPAADLLPLAASGYGVHPSLAALQPMWTAGALNVVLNTGTLYRPLTKALYAANRDLWPTNLMSHADEQAHWQGMRARDTNTDGFMGRLTDRAADTALPSLISFGGGDLILAGAKGQSLVMPSTGTIAQAGVAANSADPVVFARNSAMTALASGSGFGAVTRTIGAQITDGYTQSATANAILTATTSAVDRWFVNAAGAALTSDISRQLLRAARMIEAHGTLGQPRQTFFANHGGYDTHANQKTAHAALLLELAEAMAAFRKAMVALGLDENVTCFTMSDFGRVFKGNGSGGTDHAWGNVHLVMGGALKPRQAIGTYPTMVLGGESDGDVDGRWIPTIASEEYIGAIARWHGVADADMSYVFPNWTTWSTGGRGPIGLFA